MKGGYVELAVFLACLTLILNVYTYFIMFHGILSHFILFILFSGALFAILLQYRISKPDESLVRNYFGADWGAYSTFGEHPEDDSSFTFKVIAHRACGLDLPENSLAALKAVHKAGIKVVEFDVMLTADDVPIIFHDTNLIRMSDLPCNVSQVTFDEIKEVDISIKHPFGEKYPGEKIPTLEEYIDFCVANDIRMIIDLKSKTDKMVEVITELYKENPLLYGLSMVSSFNAVVIYKIRAKDPKIICSVAWRPYYYSHEEYNVIEGPTHPRTPSFLFHSLFKFINVLHEWALWKFGYYILGLSAVLLHKDMITRSIIDYWNKRGIRVIAWNVNLPAEKHYFEKILGVTYLTDTVISS